MFGEPIPRDALSECQRHTELCDVMLLVGTSAVVYPAADFPMQVLRQGGKLIEVNPEQTAVSSYCEIVFRAPAGQVLPSLVAALSEAA